MHILRVMSTELDIKAIRERLGLSRADLANEAGVDVSTVCRWENGGIPARGPARAFLERLSRQSEAQSEAVA